MSMFIYKGEGGQKWPKSCLRNKSMAPQWVTVCIVHILGTSCFLCKSNLLSLAPLGDKYVIYGRDQATETKLEIFNIWGDGSYRWQNREIFPIRMSNLNGRKIKATSFDYKPFCYPVDGVYQGYEVIRSLKLYLLLSIYRLFL